MNTSECKQHYNKHIIHYATVTEAINDLICRNFTLDFNLEDNHRLLNEGDFRIVDIYRYEGNTDPADESMVCAIETGAGLKGIFVTGYGVYNDQFSSLLFEKLKRS